MEYRWYAIQTTAGHENKVRSLLQKRIEDDPRPAEHRRVASGDHLCTEALDVVHDAPELLGIQ